MLLELLLRLLEPTVVYFCCYSCHKHATNVAPGSHLQLLAMLQLLQSESMSPSFWGFGDSAAATSRDRSKGRKNGLSFLLSFISSTSLSQWLAEANYKWAGKRVWAILLWGRKGEWSWESKDRELTSKFPVHWVDARLIYISSFNPHDIHWKQVVLAHIL